MIPIRELIVYKNFEQGELFANIAWILNNYDKETCRKEEILELLFKCVNELVELTESHGLEGNIWHNFLTFLLVGNENAFSTSCEVVGKSDGSIHELVKNDFLIFQQLYQFDLQRMEAILGVNCFTLMENYKSVNQNSKILSKRIIDRIAKLSITLVHAETVCEFVDGIIGFYKDFGVGKFGLHKAFRIDKDGNSTRIIPITNTQQVYLSDLVGYELQKKKLTDNTHAFVEGKKANNCFLFGDTGTGKSTSVKAILNEYYDRGLRMIEVYKHQFQDLPSVIAKLKFRNYKFIIFMDDLSFEEFETEYKYLKAVIEGGLERKPDNVLIYATSNRRHLIKENFSDKQGRQDQLHASDTVQEKLSLVARFGVSIFYGAPDQKEYRNIVKALAEKGGIHIDEEMLYSEAGKWELAHGGLSGRTAQQFINYLMAIR